MYGKLGKRIFDFVIASTMLLLLMPVMIVVWVLVRFFLGVPVIFKQIRPGLHEQLFPIYKFRTMCDARDSNGNLLADGQRLTRLGRILRSLSLDELPELINVIKGEMSLVGPRPLLEDYLPYYTTRQKKRHHMRPGITGWAQINGRNALSWEQKFELDVWYVEHCTFALDIKILIMTVIKTLKREGISAAGQATMSRFDLDQIKNQEKL